MSFLRASRSFFVRLSNGKHCFSWFLISSLTAVSKLWIFASMFFGVNELFFPLNDCKMVGSYLDIPKWALNPILLKNDFKSSSNVCLSKLRGRGQKLRPLLNNLNTSKVKLCLLKLIMRPSGSSLSLRVFQSCFAKARKLALWWSGVLACILPNSFVGGLLRFLSGCMWPWFDFFLCWCSFFSGCWLLCLS